jgi:hypothetical protein
MNDVYAAQSALSLTEAPGLTPDELDMVACALSADDVRACESCGRRYAWRVKRCTSCGAWTSGELS